MGDLSELMSQFGIGNGYMDMPSKGIMPSQPGLSYRLNQQTNDGYEDEDRQKSILLALLYKKYYPQAPDHEAGQWALKQMLNRGLNDGLFGKGLGYAQKQLGMTY